MVVVNISVRWTGSCGGGVDGFVGRGSVGGNESDFGHRAHKGRRYARFILDFCICLVDLVFLVEDVA